MPTNNTLLSTEQYLALSALSYADLSSDVPANSSVGVIMGKEYDGINFSDPQFSALASLDSWTILDYSSNNATGFSASALQSQPMRK